MVGAEILLEIDETLDRLIQNAEAIQKVSPSDLSEVEVEAFQKTQESLIHHLLHMDEQLATKRTAVIDKRASHYQIQQKRTRFENLKRSYNTTLSEARKRALITPKRRAKKLLVSR